MLAGLGIGLRSTWDIGTEMKKGDLKVVLPQYRGSSNVAIYAVYPCREFMPAKVNACIDFLAELYANEPYWDRGVDVTKIKNAIAGQGKGVAKASGKQGRIAAAAR